MPLSFALPENEAAYARLLKNGQNVSLYVRSVQADGTVRVQVAGADITARTEMPPGFSLPAGSVLHGRVFFEGNRVYIRLAADAVPRSSSLSAFLLSLGLNPSPAAVFTLSFFYSSGMRIDPGDIRRITALAAAFPGREKRACEAASLLRQKGIPLTQENIRRALEILEGVSVLPDGNAEQDSSAGEKPEYPDAASPGNRQEEAGGGGEGFPEDAFLYGSASDTASGWDWYVLPFRRPFGGRVCTGSLRFLLHRFTGEAAETRITVRDGGSCADFLVDGSRCRFVLQPEPAPAVCGKLAAELEASLQKAGLPVPVCTGGGEENLPVKPVDIEV